MDGLSGGLLITGETTEQVCALEAVERALLPKIDEMVRIELGEENHGSHRCFLSNLDVEAGTHMGKFKDCLSDSETQPRKEIDRSRKRLRNSTRVPSKPSRLNL